MKKLLLIVSIGLIYQGHAATTQSRFTKTKIASTAAAAAGALGGAYAAYKMDRWEPLVLTVPFFLSLLAYLPPSSSRQSYEDIEQALDYLELEGPYAEYKNLWYKRNYLFNTTLSQDNFDEALQESDCESVDFPLIAIFQRLQQYDQVLMKLREKSDQALFDTSRPPLYDKSSEFYKMLKIQRTRLDQAIKRIRHNLSTVKKHAHWKEQWKIYQKRDATFKAIQQLVPTSTSFTTPACGTQTTLPK